MWYTFDIIVPPSPEPTATSVFLWTVMTVMKRAKGLPVAVPRSLTANLRPMEVPIIVRNARPADGHAILI